MCFYSGSYTKEGRNKTSHDASILLGTVQIIVVKRRPVNPGIINGLFKYNAKNMTSRKIRSRINRLHALNRSSEVWDEGVGDRSLHGLLVGDE